MLTGIRLRANPTIKQKLILSQWMGCARVVWNAKVDEERYYRTYARKYCTIGIYAPIDQKAAQFKDKEFTPWLSDCPSQILRNSAVNWYDTYQKFMKGTCGRPKRKSKDDGGSIHLTRELFQFEHCTDGNVRLFVGSKTNNIGYLNFKRHADFNLPNSLHIRKERGRYYVSFCYENNQLGGASHADNLALLAGASRAWLEENTVGVDRGVVVPVQAGERDFDYQAIQKKRMEKAARYIQRMQRRLARQQKGSNRRKRTKQRINTYYAQQANIRTDFAHKTSRALVNSAKVIIFEALPIQRMTKKAKPKKDENGKFISNRKQAKSGLNKAILNIGWHKIASFTEYKAKQAGVACFKINPAFTSQECAKCEHIHPSNRPSQAMFHCVACGHTDNADHNASAVLAKRGINLILDSGTELTNNNMLVTGRGGIRKTKWAENSPRSAARSVKKERAATVVLEARPL